MKGPENTRGVNALNAISMVAGLLAVAGSFLANQNGVTVSEVNELGLCLSVNSVLAIIQTARWVPHALELNELRYPAERKAHFNRAFNEMGLAFVNIFGAIICGVVSTFAP